jgi:hypothetical protein
MSLKEKDELIKERDKILAISIHWLNPFHKIRLDKIELRLKEIELERQFASWANYKVSVVAGEVIEPGDLINLVGDHGVFTAFKARKQLDIPNV